MCDSDVRLFPHTPQMLRALAAGVKDYERLTSLSVAIGLRDFLVGPDVSPEFLEQLRKREDADLWKDGFGVVLAGMLIGFCSFTGPPNESGIAEIAYGIAPDFQGRGYATDAARSLIAIAKDSGQVCGLRAHTLPQTNASTRVLQKCGFTFVDEVMHPEDGKVWRWERPINLPFAEPPENSRIA